uniref:Uncharacterized protein n=1 Tax=Panagrolaimus sp. ES5 TaxID=591445 RepID=A0AC34F201_9BILA
MSILFKPPPAPSSDFPSDVLKWMKECAKAKMALKLMKCHKYFQHEKFQYFVVEDVSYDENEDEWTLDMSNDKRHVYEGLQNIPKMLWITDSIHLYGSISNLTSVIIPKIVVCDITHLHLSSQIIVFDDFKFLTPFVEYFYFRNTTIKYQNGDTVFLDQLFECLPNVKHIRLWSGTPFLFSENFVNSIEKINLMKLKFVILYNIAYSDIEKFSKFMEKNRHIYYDLDVADAIISAEGILALEKYNQGIIDNGITEFPPPLIKFKQQTKKQGDTLERLRYQYMKEKSIEKQISYNFLT